MRLSSLSMLACGLFLVAAACSNTTGNTSTGSTDTGGGDTQTIGDTAQNDTTGGTDGAVNDTGSKDVQDTTGTDATPGTDIVDEKSADTDAVILTDSDSPDVSDAQIPGDTTATDIYVPDVPPGSCTKDADCLGLNFAPCQIGYCDATAKMCKVKAAADGGACSVGGSCGGPGTCKKGGCDAPTTCKPDVCSPQELACGSKIVIDLGTLGASSFGGYGNCSSSKWAGPELAILLTSDVTMTASLSLDSTGVTADAQMFDIAPTLDGKCDTAACDDSSYYALTIGLPAGVPRIVILDTSAPDTGTVTLTLDCTVTTICGDGTCDASESCSTCAKDCGGCSTTGCGDGKCDANENCITCVADCGACVPGCLKSGSPGCGGCACEACVCNDPNNGDPYCCKNSWDSTCVKECKACSATACGTFNDVCGDAICGSNEDSTSCPNDCGGSYLYCGDGICSASEKEDCKGCSQDCGYCMMAGLASVGCGDGTCSGDENCTTCTADCGVCGDYSCACLADSTCCTESFGYYCQDACNTCIATAGGGSCPISNCGDGVCSGETCKSCSTDCGECPAYCGDGNCDPGEDKATCATDCGTGCQGKCGKSSKESDGTYCWCDTYCASSGDCCSDIAAFCP